MLSKNGAKGNVKLNKTKKTQLIPALVILAHVQ